MRSKNNIKKQTPKIAKTPAHQNLQKTGSARTSGKHTERMLRAQSEILEMVAANKPLHSIFQRLTKLNDALTENVHSSILLLDEERRKFAEAIATSIPQDYSKLLIGIEIGDNIGSCGTACYRGETVIVDDIENDPKWAPFVDLVLPFGFRSCWSSPIISKDGSVLGSFALYSKSVRTPTTLEIELVEMSTRLASIAIDNHTTLRAIRTAAESDPLTGLTNRSSFSEKLKEKIARTREENGRFVIAYLDLDGFKSINDQYGHHCGDELLTIVAKRLSQVTIENTVVARLGGDEFAVISNIQAPESGMLDRVQVMLETLTQPVVIDSNQLDISTSVGIAVYPDHGETADELLNRADVAMYHAKRSGRNRVRLYDAKIDQETRDHEKRLKTLENAIQAGEIDIDFQPQFGIDGQTVFGFEALARWQSPSMGRLLPAYFIALAEEADLIAPIGQSVLTKACHQARLWSQEAQNPPCVAVNVSAHQFRDGLILKQVEHALAESGLDPRFLELELTETVLMHDARNATEIMNRLKSLGVRIALDDFGTGYSNLSALATFPIDTLKIDRSIVKNIEYCDASAAITSAIIAMGHKLDMKVLAEGVETEKQLEFLASNNCDLVQGFLFGKPIGCTQTLNLAKFGAFMPETRKTLAVTAF